MPRRSAKDNIGKIGVFDSGLGGLTVLRHFLAKLPQYDYVYLGDSARAPYGEKSQETIYEYTRQAVSFLFNQGCSLVVLACNTASSQALRRLQQAGLPEGHKVLGVIRPIAERYGKTEGRIAVLGTKATITSGAYEREIRNLSSKADIISAAAPLLVPLIEEGWSDKSATTRILKHYLLGLKSKHPSALILACTHYPLMLEKIRKIMGKSCEVADPGEIVAKSLADYITRHSEISLLGRGTTSFFTTDDPAKFQKLGRHFLGQEIVTVKHANLL